MNRSQFPNGGWQFVQPQTGWSAPNPVANTFEQTVTNIIKHRLANPAQTQKHKLSTNYDVIAAELERYTETRLGIVPKQLPPPPQRASVSGAVAGAVAGVKKLAAGAALLLDWEQSKMPPESNEVASARAAVCETCPKNSMDGLSRHFTIPVAERIRKQLARLHEMNLTTPSDAKLGICTACLCELKLKSHTPKELILKWLKPEQKAELNQDKPRCWVLDL